MPNFDILFIDMDDTLLGADHLTISGRTRRALKAAQDAGVKLAVASGRTMGILPDAVREADFDYALISNGAAVFDLRTKERLYHQPFPVESARVACDLIRDRADFIEFFADGQILLTREHYKLIGTRSLPIWHRLHLEKGGTPVVDSIDAYLDAGAPGLEKINLVRYDPEFIRFAHDQLEPTGLFKLTGSIIKSMEVNAAGCSKGTAVVEFCKQLNIPIERAAAFGDADNDAEMLQAAGCGVAMGNAPDSIKALAKHVTATNVEDGVAKFIEDHVL